MISNTMNNKVKWARYKSWSGCRISSGVKWELSDEQKQQHMYRAMFLTSQLETFGKFGPVNSYDGAGISAGLEHNIAVYPKYMKQGPLWKNLRELELYAPCDPLHKLWEALKSDNKYIDQSGVLRNYSSGAETTALEIRNMVAPPGGRVPKSGENWEKAKEWAVLFHDLYVNPATFEVQVNSAIRALVAGNGRNEAAAYKTTIGKEHPSAIRFQKDISVEHDLAWCVYHSFSVNAPGKARRVLSSSDPDNTKEWPGRLVRDLGTTRYGNWHDTVEGRSRYDRTRNAAMRSGMWPNELFVGSTAIMPKNL